MGTFVDAINKGYVNYGMGEQAVDVTYNLGDGNHKITINSSNTNVVAGNGDNIIKHYGSNAYIRTGDGNHKITSIGDNKTITTGDGDDDVVFVGDNCNVDLKNGNNSVVFWGNNCNIQTGDGDDSVTTFDQVYQEGQYEGLKNAFLDRLPTGTWEKWTKVSSDLIDTRKKRHTFKTTYTYVYENHYDVETIFSRYINGVQNTNIDMGSGSNTANVTMGKGSKISGSGGTNDITYNKKWQIDESLGHRDEVKITQKKKSKTRWATIIGGTIGLSFLAGDILVGTAATTVLAKTTK